MNTAVRSSAIAVLGVLAAACWLLWENLTLAALPALLSAVAVMLWAFDGSLTRQLKSLSRTSPEQRASVTPAQIKQYRREHPDASMADAVRALSE